MKQLVQLIAGVILLSTVLSGCSGRDGNQDLYIFEELETASSLEDPSGRVERLKIFAANNPDHPARSIAYSRIFETMVVDMNDEDGSLVWFGQVMEKEKEPFIRGDLLYRKFAFLWEKDKESAILLAEQILAGSESDYRLHLYLCYYLMSEESSDKLTEKLFEKLQGLTSNEYKLKHARSVYGEFLFDRNREDEGVAVLAKAGDYPFANEKLATYLWEKDMRKEAIESYIMFVAGAPGAREHVNVDSLYSLVYPDSKDLNDRISAMRIIDEGVLPDMDFSDLNGMTHKLSEYRGDILIISAWSPT
ncbi:MAG: hypothetical protein KOO63_08585 [Bacteroidales bacterium]|nr:hypothetical protein [Candidatus Latescibacterota bacterium]